MNPTYANEIRRKRDTNIEIIKFNAARKISSIRKQRDIDINSVQEMALTQIKEQPEHDKDENIQSKPPPRPLKRVKKRLQRNKVQRLNRVKRIIMFEYFYHL